MHWRFFDVINAAFDFGRSDALAIFWCHRCCTRFRTIRCTGEVVCWCQRCCIWCWNHLMHWRFFDVKDAAFDLERSDALAVIWFFVCYQAVGRASCWLKCSLSSYRAGELFDWWNDAGVARRQMWFCWQCCRAEQNINVLFDADQSRVKNWCLDDCSSQSKKMILTRITITSLDRSLLQLNQSNCIEFSSANQSKSKSAADISQIASKTVFRKCI